MEFAPFSRKIFIAFGGIYEYYKKLEWCFLQMQGVSILLSISFLF